MKTLSIIIPVYNEQKTISEIINRVQRVPLTGLKKQIIIVDDASTDRSRLIIKRHQNKYPRLIQTYVSFINLGKGAAVRMGLKMASGDFYIIQDADAELQPEEFSLLLAPILAGQSDVVYGSRFAKKNQNISFTNRVANQFLTTLVNILFHTQLTDMETAYKVFTKKVKNSLHLRAVGFDFEPEITAQIIRNGFSITEVPITYIPRKRIEGKKIGFWDGIFAIVTIFRYRFEKTKS